MVSAKAKATKNTTTQTTEDDVAVEQTVLTNTMPYELKCTPAVLDSAMAMQLQLHIHRLVEWCNRNIETLKHLVTLETMVLAAGKPISDKIAETREQIMHTVLSITTDASTLRTLHEVRVSLPYEFVATSNNESRYITEIVMPPGNYNVGCLPANTVLSIARFDINVGWLVDYLKVSYFGTISRCINPTTTVPSEPYRPRAPYRSQ